HQKSPLSSRVGSFGRPCESVVPRGDCILSRANLRQSQGILFPDLVVRGSPDPAPMPTAGLQSLRIICVELRSFNANTRQTNRPYPAPSLADRRQLAVR